MRPPRNRPGRAHKVAGRQPERVVEAPVVEEPVVEEAGGFETGASAPSSTTDPEPVVEEAGGFETGASAPSSTTGAAVDEPVVEEGRSPVSRPPRSGLTAILVAVVAVLALVGVAEIVYLVRDPAPTVSAERPVVTGELTHRSAVDAAARSTEQILSTSFQDYDAQVDQATDQMTETFAEEYRTTADGIKAQFVKQRTKLQVKAVAQGVVQASPEQVQALLFLNQYVEKVQDGEPATAYAQYRALVTVVRTDHGWLVSDIETK
ncbi:MULTISPECIES: hypothetical protein [unclassified Nocardioides]|uniref:hypothetical protein n=1 Tax=unclassified Nocardioides TaxID=2615069 RepID=UPI00361C8EA2